MLLLALALRLRTRLVESVVVQLLALMLRPWAAVYFALDYAYLCWRWHRAGNLGFWLYESGSAVVLAGFLAGGVNLLADYLFYGRLTVTPLSFLWLPAAPAALAASAAPGADWLFWDALVASGNWLVSLPALLGTARTPWAGCAVVALGLLQAQAAKTLDQLAPALPVLFCSFAVAARDFIQLTAPEPEPATAQAGAEPPRPGKRLAKASPSAPSFTQRNAYAIRYALVVGVLVVQLLCFLSAAGTFARSLGAWQAFYGGAVSAEFRRYGTKIPGPVCATDMAHGSWWLPPHCERVLLLPASAAAAARGAWSFAADESLMRPAFMLRGALASAADLPPDASERDRLAALLEHSDAALAAEALRGVTHVFIVAGGSHAPFADASAVAGLGTARGRSITPAFGAANTTHALMTMQLLHAGALGEAFELVVAQDAPVALGACGAPGFWRMVYATLAEIGAQAGLLRQEDLRGWRCAPRTNGMTYWRRRGAL